MKKKGKRIKNSSAIVLCSKCDTTGRTASILIDAIYVRPKPELYYFMFKAA